MELKFYTKGKRRKRKSDNAKMQTKYKTIVLDNLVAAHILKKLE